MHPFKICGYVEVFSFQVSCTLHSARLLCQPNEAGAGAKRLCQVPLRWAASERKAGLLVTWRKVGMHPSFKKVSRSSFFIVNDNEWLISS